jgi:hypothetical protein
VREREREEGKQAASQQTRYSLTFNLMQLPEGHAWCGLDRKREKERDKERERNREREIERERDK